MSDDIQQSQDNSAIRQMREQMAKLEKEAEAARAEKQALAKTLQELEDREKTELARKDSELERLRADLEEKKLLAQQKEELDSRLKVTEDFLIRQVEAALASVPEEHREQIKVLVGDGVSPVQQLERLNALVKLVVPKNGEPQAFGVPTAPPSVPPAPDKGKDPQIVPTTPGDIPFALGIVEGLASKKKA